MNKLQRLILFFGMLFLSGQAYSQAETEPSKLNQIYLQAGLDYSGYSLALDYQRGLGPIAAELGVRYNLSDGTIQDPVWGLDLGCYMRWAQQDKRTAYLGPAFRYSKLTSEIDLQLWTLRSQFSWALPHHIQVNASTGYGAAVESGPIGKHIKLTGSIQFGCGIRF